MIDVGDPSEIRRGTPLQMRTSHRGSRRRPAILPLLLFWAVGLQAAQVPTATASGPVSAGTRGTPIVSPDPRLYVCVQDEAKIAIVNMESLAVDTVIDLTTLGFSMNAKPHHIAVEPDGEHWYVSLIGENRVVRFDRAGRIAGQFEMETPGMLALDADRDELLVSRSMSAVSPPTRLGRLVTDEMDGDEIEVVMPRPHPVVISADGRWGYTGSLGTNQIAAIDLENEEVTITEVAGPPHAFVQFALSPDGGVLVASTELSGRLLAFRLDDPARPELIADVEVGPQAFDPAFAPDGGSVWVPIKGANQVAIIDVATWSVRERLEAPSLLQPHAIVFSPDGRYAFISNNNAADHMADPSHTAAGGHAGGAGNVTVFAVVTRTVVTALELGRNVTGMGRAPAGFEREP